MPCESGTYTHKGESTTCFKCEKGYYNDEVGMTECKHCDYPNYSVFEGSIECKGYWLNISNNYLIIIFTLLSIIFLIGLFASKDKKIAAFGIMAFPTLVSKILIIFI